MDEASPLPWIEILATQRLVLPTSKGPLLSVQDPNTRLHLLDV